MSFPLTVYLGSLVGAFLASCATLPFWRQWCLRIGLVDEPGNRKIHAEPVALAGGFAVVAGLFAPLLAGAVLLGFERWLGDSSGLGIVPGLSDEAIEKLSYGFGARRTQLGGILLGVLGMLVLGWLDDRHELAPLPKFAGQVFLAILTAAAGVRVTLFVPSLAFSYAITVLWLLTMTNALNFLDNMNGLCAGVGAIAAAFFAIAAARNGQYLVTSIAVLVCGALLGFLPWNYPRALAFLGDSGSHVTGYLLAVLAILPSFYSEHHPRAPAVLSPLLVLIVPLADLASVVWIRLRLRHPPWVGDTNHFSHRLVRAGWAPQRVVLFLWLVGVAGGVASLLL